MRVAIKLKCVCGAKYTLQTVVAGKKVRCKSCGNVLRVPSLMENDCMEALRGLAPFDGPQAENLGARLGVMADKQPHGGRYRLNDSHFSPGTLALVRAQDLAAELAEKGMFQRNPAGRREMVFFKQIEGRTVPSVLDGGTELVFSFGLVAPSEDPANAWTYYKVDPNLFLAIANGAAAQATTDTGDEDEEVVTI